MRTKRSSVAVAAGLAVVLGLWSGWSVYADSGRKPDAVPGTLYALATRVPQEVLVEVNGEPLTRSEVDAAVEALFGAELSRLPNAERAVVRGQLEARVLDDLISRTLLFQHARVQKIAIAGDEVDASLARLAASLPVGATVSDYAAAVGITPEDLRENIELGLRVEALLARELDAVEVPSEGEVAAFYAENREQFELPERAEVRHVLIAVGPDDAPAVRETKRAEAERIREQLSGDPDANFARVAAEDSDCGSAADGGRLGAIARGDLVAALEQAIFAQEVGEIGPVVETEFGFHVIRVDARSEPSSTPLSAVADAIAQSLTEQRREGALANYIAALEAAASIVFPAQAPA